MRQTVRSGYLSSSVTALMRKSNTNVQRMVPGQTHTPTLPLAVFARAAAILSNSSCCTFDGPGPCRSYEAPFSSPDAPADLMGPQTKLEVIPRRLAWPLQKDDTYGIGQSHWRSRTLSILLNEGLAVQIQWSATRLATGARYEDSLRLQGSDSGETEQLETHNCPIGVDWSKLTSGPARPGQTTTSTSRSRGACGIR